MPSTDQHNSTSMASSSRPIAGASNQRSQSAGHSPFSTSFHSGSPLAEESIARDLADCSDEEDAVSTDSYPDGGADSEYVSEASAVRPSHHMSDSYRRPSFVAFGGNRPAIAPQHPEINHLSKKEKAKARSEEQSLLRDNHLTPSKHPRPKDEPLRSRIYRRLFSTKVPKRKGDETPETFVPASTPEPSEISPLLSDGAPESAREIHERSNRLWEDAVREGKIQTTWQREAKTLTQYSAPLIITFLLQYSLTVASIFTVGHIGKIELGAGKTSIIVLL